MITVKQLIGELKHYNPQARVIVNTGYDNDTAEQDYDYIYHIGWSYRPNGDTNKDLVVLNR